MSNPNRLAIEWQVFYRKVLPDGASDVQTQEMRRAFYAGAEAAVFRVLMQSFSPGDEAKETDIVIMQNLADELAQFAQDVAKGKA